MNTDERDAGARQWQPRIDVRGDTAADGAPANTSLAFDVHRATTTGGDRIRVYTATNLLTRFLVANAFDEDSDGTDAGCWLDQLLTYRRHGTHVEAVVAADESLHRTFVRAACEALGTELLPCDPAAQARAA